MTQQKKAVVGWLISALVMVLFVVPSMVSVAHGDGKICVTDSACPLSVINPCVRDPSFAVLGRCAIPIK